MFVRKRGESDEQISSIDLQRGDAIGESDEDDIQHATPPIGNLEGVSKKEALISANSSTMGDASIRVTHLRCGLCLNAGAIRRRMVGLRKVWGIMKSIGK